MQIAVVVGREIKNLSLVSILAILAVLQRLWQRMRQMSIN